MCLSPRHHFPTLLNGISVLISHDVTGSIRSRNRRRLLRQRLVERSRQQCHDRR